MMKKIIQPLIILSLALLVFSCDQGKKKEAGEASDRQARPVKVMLLDKDSVDRTLEYTANLLPFEELNYAPAQPGRISAINAEVGDRVQKGDILVEMDKTQLNQARIQLEEARRNFARLDTLYRLNSMSKQQYDQAKTAYEMAKSNLQFLQENTSLIAPFSGIVTEKYFEAGEMFTGTPNTPSGKAAVLTLMQIKPLKAVVNVTENYFPEIHEGMKARVYSDIYPEKNFEATVIKTYPTINQVTRTFRVELKIDNNSELLRPGMFSRVEILLKNNAAMLSPSIAVLKQEGTNNRYVFVNEEGTARKVPVELGSRYDDKIEILSPELEVGMELIIAGQATLMDGDAVKVVQ